VEMDKLNANGSSSESDINRNISKATNVTAISAAEEYWKLITFCYVRFKAKHDFTPPGLKENFGDFQI